MYRFIFLWSLLLMALCPASAFADKRVALVIGNGAYQHAEPLPNPRRDASAIAELLEKVGFNVEVRNELSNLDFKRTLHDFATAAQGADIVIVYYAGHDAQIRDRNYLIPVNAKIEREDDVDEQAIAFEDVLKTTEGAKRLRLLLLDSNGLAKVDESRVSALGDTLIAYAARPGSIALDGEGQHSPFTGALLKHLTEPGLDIRRMLDKVRDDVRQSTRGAQDPFYYGAVGGDEISLVPAAATPLSRQAAPNLKGKQDDLVVRPLETTPEQAAEAKRKAEEARKQAEEAKDKAKNCLLQPNPQKQIECLQDLIIDMQGDIAALKADREHLREIIDQRIEEALRPRLHQ